MPKLNKSFVDKISSPGRYRDSDLAGFVLRVSASGKKTYFVDNKLKGSRRNVTVTLGKHGVITAEQARVDARKVLAVLATGVHPNEEKRAQLEQARLLQAEKDLINSAKKRTLKVVLEDYFESRRLKESTAYGYRKVINRCLPDWLNLPLTDISRDMVEARHKSLSAEHPAQANQVMIACPSVHLRLHTRAPQLALQLALKRMLLLTE